MDRGITCITVLDVSGAALSRARRRLGERAERVNWIEADVAGEWHVAPVDIWHDRAVLHFLTGADQRDGYVRQLRQALKIGGSAIIGTFALDGPPTCSGLPVERYSPELIVSLLGPDFHMEEAFGHVHQTPKGQPQPFTFTRFTKWTI